MAIKEGRKRIQITLSEKTLENLDAYCQQSGMARNAYLEYIIASSLDTATQLKDRISAALSMQVKDASE